jgi:hypothetical protein
MLIPFSRVSMSVLLALACIASTATMQASAQPASGAPGMMPQHLFSERERMAFCDQMQHAATPEERQVIVQRMRDRMIARAKERGIALPPGMENGGTMMGHGGVGMGMGWERGGAGLACGANASDPSRQMAAPEEMVEIEHDHGIAYVTGGVGEDEATALRAVASHYSLRAEFTRNGGEFLSGVTVELHKADGALIFAATSNGPYLYAQIPPGSYQLTARSDGVQRTRTINVPQRGGISIAMTWPAQSNAD